ncbi:hypothetical protein PORY_000208 [Pneumocystis oryctolagi]|uniref:Uncharacterized protein n=1 Tax=Pneumocystis oryctolagi TaxID=42067 RepID=A0ACB7CGE7_9ASCO|nr:hypothetical protein PORY_000208 [Pneumocystis oryctolagi]
MHHSIMKFFHLFESLKSQPECSKSFKRRRVHNSAQFEHFNDKDSENSYINGHQIDKKDLFFKKNSQQSFCNHKNEKILGMEKNPTQTSYNVPSMHNNLHISRKNTDVLEKPLTSNDQKRFINFPVRLPKATMTGRELFENALKMHDNIVCSNVSSTLTSILSQKKGLFYNLRDFRTSFIKRKSYPLKFTDFNESSDTFNDSLDFDNIKIFENNQTPDISQTEDLFSSPLSLCSHTSQKRTLNLDNIEVHKDSSQIKYMYNFQKHRFENDNDSFNELIKQLKEQYQKERFYNWNNLQKQKQERDYEIQKLKDLSIGPSHSPSLSKELLKKVEDALCSDGQNDPLIVKFNISITSHDIRTLRDKEWLNDEIINFYIALISERAKASPEGPKVYAFNTFFYTTLEKKGYRGVQRWTKRAKVNIMQQDYVFVPIHLGIHWCMSVINFKKKRIEYWDSLNGSSGNTFQLLRDYLVQESGNTIDLDKWKNYIPESGPIQRNGYDCGVFACKTAECIARESPVDYTQDDIKELRKRMTTTISLFKIMSSDSDIEDEIQDYSSLRIYKKNTSFSLFPKRGEKDYEPDGTSKQDEMLKRSIDSMFDVISKDRCISKKVYSKAIWISNVRLAKVERMRGTQFKSLGKCVNNVTWLLPEEVIYLVERGSLECWWENGIPMSLQAVYSVCLEECGGVERYQVYSYLKRLGYYVFRPVKVENETSVVSSTVYNSKNISPFFGWMKSLMKFVYSVFERYSTNNWNTLVKRLYYYSYDQIYKSLEIIPYHCPPSSENYICNTEKKTDPFNINYYVWKPAPNFKKSKLQNPDFRIIVINVRSSSLPSLKEFANIFDSVPLKSHEPNTTPFERLRNGTRQIIFALLDSGVISFIKFSDIGFGNEKMYIKYHKHKKNTNHLWHKNI